MPSTLIDVWDPKTFDEELAGILEQETDLVRNYMTTERHIFLDYDLGRNPSSLLMRPQNPYSAAFIALKERLSGTMQSRTIRAWHYSRLTDHEIVKLRNEGVHLSTPTALRARLDALVATGELTGHVADALYSMSPFHSEQLDARAGKFWMSSHPVRINDSGVVPLMAHWGGEVASMFVKDPLLLEPLAAIGKPRIVELAVPLSLTPHSYSAAIAILASFGRSLKCVSEKKAFDLYVALPLKSEAILRVHSQGEPEFNGVGFIYPKGYIDVDIGYWEELTGEVE